MSLSPAIYASKAGFTIGHPSRAVGTEAETKEAENGSCPPAAFTLILENP